MSGVSLPVTRPSGRALLIGNPASRGQVLESLEQLGYECAPADDPYSAMVELCRRPLVYRAVILSLASLYQEELAIIRAIKRRYPHVELWLAHTDGRQAALAEAMRLGADGLLAEDGLHRVAMGGASAEEPALPRPQLSSASAPEPRPAAPAAEDLEAVPGEPLLTADELKALLHEQPSMPPAGEEQT